jgi:poly(A) polymerase
MDGAMTEREVATDVVHRLREAGFEALFAGGCVRDELLGLVPYDHDIATDATPDQVRALFRRTVAVGASFGVVEVLGPRTDAGPLKVQVATFRSDVSYSDGRRPDSVTFSSPREDALRRDFTVNGMFLNPLTGEVIDYVGGRADLEAGVLRAIGEPAERFREDKLRLLRAVRMAARFGLTLDPATADAARAMAPEITVVSAERIADELRKMLGHPNRGRGVRLLDELGLVAPVLQELEETKGVPQGRPSAPTGDLWAHTLAVVERLPAAASFPLAFAALYHDVGKVRTIARQPDRYTFHGHEFESKRMANEACLRLKLSNEERERIEWLVEKHQYLSDAPKMRLSRLKPVLAHVGIDELLTLHRADAEASGRSLDHVEFCEAKLREWPPEVLNPPPLITGDDLKAELGLEPGPRFKTLLEAVREGQLEGSVNTRREALALVRRKLQEG